MSGEHSVAAMGSVKSSSLARKIRMAILERGAVLAGIMKLMATSSPRHPAVNTTIGSEFIIDAPISPLRTATSPTCKRRLTRSSSLSSSSTAPDFQPTVNSSSSPPIRILATSSKAGGDPTAMGRRNRKKRRKQKVESSTDGLFPPSMIVNMDSIPERGGDWKENEDSKRMPPPTKRKSRCPNREKSDELSFADVSVLKEPAGKLWEGFKGKDDGSSIVSEASTEGTSVFASRITQKVDDLCAKVCIESSSSSNCSMDAARKPFSLAVDTTDAYFTERKYRTGNDFFPGGDRPWLTMVCLEAITRILTGKELNGKTSCLEGEVAAANKGGGEDESDGVDDENSNVFVVTNRLVGKSGILPLLASAMSQTMIAATRLVFPETCRKLANVNKNSECNTIEEEQQWYYCHNRMKLLVACFFSEQNRRSFCEEDPFSFEDQKKGLIFHLLLFLHHCSKCNLKPAKRSETMSLSLRTLTSLTHDNPLAADQMKISNNSCVEGIDVLANLVFHLEEYPSSNPTNRKRATLTNLRKATDHDMHRYDGTIFCLTTLANIIEGSGVRSSLIEIKIGLKSGATLSWLQWLCQWVVKQTETFRQEILSIGSKSNNTGSKNINSNGTSTTDNEDEELQNHEEEKLVAAGNGCVVLACLMTDADADDPESSTTIRKLVKDEMPINLDGNSSRLALVVNTLKAYCNYYHISMGQMSFAVVAPVKKLIDELEEIIEFDESKSIG
eukprot:CAMPEP_0168162916 /NCGR_PEP_ID=MMETSP0139_2-20121125/86_1 /TAXON_ID=44445 /ORGANISM="Pseudo-nitzschia australis, Strain 10249 10 AB" /LENGTH=728 /DNA_ID=CAMNT_0008079753 /DNA_START=153 /DNA_END=2338 /DNA_ORIENTATION=-